ncbi:MAG: hypothetical protein AAGD23_11315 [Pseudomonadota bacterium]
MTQPENNPALSPDMNRILGPNPSNANLVYILYLCALLVGVTMIIGLVLAYMNRCKAPDWLQTHYTFLIRTFWIGLIFFVICFATSFILIGLALFIVLFIWFIVRMLRGMQALGERAPVKNYTRWGF